MAAMIVHKGAKLAYEDRGTGRPAFVFVHGWACNRSSFAPQAEHFSPHHRVVSIDLRGHGESDRAAENISIAAYAEDVAHLIKQLEPGRVVAVGHSMGALVVLQLAAAHPEQVLAVVMVDPASFVRSPEQRAGVEALAAAVDAGNQELVRQFIVNRLFLPKSDRQLVNDVLALMLSAPSDVFTADARAMLAFDGPAVAAQCKVPVLHLAATRPFNPPHLMSQWLPTVVTGCTVGGGHFNQLEVPDQVNAMIEGFLRQHV